MLKKDALISIAIFIVILVVISTGGYLLTVWHSAGSTPLMWSVGLSAILTCLIRKKDLASLGLSFGSWKYHGLSYTIPVFYICISYAIIWSFGFGESFNTDYIVELKNKYNLTNINDSEVVIFAFLFFGTVGFLNVFVSALGEEIGWRGFLAPELSKCMSFGWVSVVSGVLWSIWHWPLIFMGVLGGKGSSIIYQLFFFTILLISMSVIMTYIRFKSGSTLAAAVFHASHNIFLQKFFNALTIPNQNTVFYADENGAIPAMVACLVAIFFWRRARFLPGMKIT